MRPLIAHAAGLFHRFLRWWLAELAALVPENLRAALAARGGAVVVDACGPEIVVVRSGGGGRREVARLPNPGRTQGGGPEAAAPGVGGRLRAVRGRDLVLRLPAEAALRKALSLPLAAEASLREVLRFELDRQTPFRPEEVYFDCRVLERLPGAQRITVELTVLARAVVDPVLAGLARWGLEPARVEGAAAEPDGRPAWACRLPAREGSGDGERAALARLLNPALATLAVVLAGAAVYLPIARQEALLADLQADLAAEKRRADDTLRLKETLAALQEEALFLVDRKRENAPVLEIWNEVTRIMPDHSFALELRLRGREVEVVGQSEAATGLLDVIEGSPLFHRAAFRSPITRGRGGEAERFHLAFEVRGQGGEPEPQRQAADGGR